MHIDTCRLALCNCRAFTEPSPSRAGERLTDPERIAVLLTELARVEQERDEARTPTYWIRQRLQEEVDELQAQLTARDQTIAQLRDIIREISERGWGHIDTCPHYSDNFGKPCSCGWDAFESKVYAALTPPADGPRT